MSMDDFRRRSAAYGAAAWGNRRWQDWANLVLAAWLFLSPWILAFGTAAGSAAGAPDAASRGGASGGAASWDAWILAVLIAIVAVMALSARAPWQEWVNLAFGAWLVVAPWVLGFSGLPVAAWDHWVVGILVFLVSAFALSEGRTAALPEGDLAHAGDRPTRPEDPPRV